MKPHVDRLHLFDIQRFCVHDGPGIRTVVFLKGCSLRCSWCQNPESLRHEAEMAFYSDRCAGCLVCQEGCSHGAIRAGASRIDRTQCQTCGTCAEACPHEALRMIGWWAEPQEVLEEVARDRAYYASSGGGVTLSGGEPLLQANGCAQFLSLCRAQGIDTVVETCGAVPPKAFQKVMPHVGAFYFDLKGWGDAQHRELTGGAQRRILRNAEQLVEAGADVTFRMTIVPGLNDDEKTFQGIARFLLRLGRPSIHLLSYHPGGESKLERLESTQPKLGLTMAEGATALRAAANRFESLGLAVHGQQHESPPKKDKGTLFPPRVWRLRDEVQAAEPTVCAERALLVTQYAKDHGNRSKPVMIQKAEALRHVLTNKKAQIHDHELLVGNFTQKRVGGSIFPELHGVAMLEDLLNFDKRKVNPLAIDARDRAKLAYHVMPYWTPRFLGIRAFPLPKALRFVVDQLSGKRYLINETGGISHFVPDYAKLLALGTEGIVKEARRRADQTDGPDKMDFYRAVEIVCDGLEHLASSFASEARRIASGTTDPARRAELEKIAGVCQRVPRHPARTLHEAFQSILFAQIALNLESLDNAVSPGRLDQILLPTYRADVDTGRLDESGARDLIGCFTVKMSEIIPVFSRRVTRFHGGMFNGQVVVVGGVDRAGQDATNELTWLFLDAVDALRMRQPNYHARFHASSPTDYVARVAEMVRDGSGAPSLMNDEVVVPMLTRRGATLQEARDYSPVGCVEPVASGVTFASTDAALVNLALCLEWTLGVKKGGARTPRVTDLRTMSDITSSLRRQIDHMVDLLMKDLQAIERANALLHPTPLSSMLLEGCLQSGLDSTAGGTRHNGSGVQGVGVADVADSLSAIEEVVFRQWFCDLSTVAEALRSDFVGHESLLGYLMRAPKYGNDDPRADRWANLVMRMFSDSLSRTTNTRGGPYWAGFYAVTAHQAFGETTGALPSGRRAGQSLASGLSPANGRERKGPTAALGSTAGLDLIDTARNGINLNLKLDKTALASNGGATALAGLFQGYFAQGGMQVQANVLDPNVLLEAQRDPRSHPWLLVRVSGYSAYFNDLSPEMKQEIIDRSLHRA